MVRLQPDQLGELDAWIAAQPEPRPTRPEAVRRMLQEVFEIRSRNALLRSQVEQMARKAHPAVRLEIDQIALAIKSNEATNNPHNLLLIHENLQQRVALLIRRKQCSEDDFC